MTDAQTEYEILEQNIINDLERWRDSSVELPSLTNEIATKVKKTTDQMIRNLEVDNPKKPASKIQRFSDISGESMTNIMGIPRNLIVIGNVDNTSFEEQHSSIIQTAVEPLKEIYGHFPQFRVISHGSAQRYVENNTEVLPKDIDLFVLIDPVFYNTIGAPDTLSANARKIYDVMRSSLDEVRVVNFAIAGDNITQEHILQINLGSTDNFLEDVGRSIKDKQSLLSSSLKDPIMSGRKEKLQTYIRKEQLFADALVSSGVVILGNETLDRRDVVFRHKNDEL